jgi:hypothetical protein
MNPPPNSETLRDFSIRVQRDLELGAGNETLEPHDLYHGLSAALLMQLLSEEGIEADLNEIPWNHIFLESLTSLMQRFMESDNPKLRNFNDSSVVDSIEQFIATFYADYNRAITSDIEGYVREIFTKAKTNNPNYREITIPSDRKKQTRRCFDNGFFDNSGTIIDGIASMMAKAFLNDERSLIPTDFHIFWLVRVKMLEENLRNNGQPWGKRNADQKENTPLTEILNSVTKDAYATASLPQEQAKIDSDDYKPLGIRYILSTLITRRPSLLSFLDQSKGVFIPVGIREYAQEALDKPAREILKQAETRNTGISLMVTKALQSLGQ